MTSRTLTITTVSPIHIGSGRPDLRENVDFIFLNKKTYMLNVDRVLEHILPLEDDDSVQSEYFETIMTTMRFDSFFKKEKELTDHPNLYRYRTWAKSSSTEIRPQQQTAFNELYIPGSTLKGALRTAWIRSQFRVGIDERMLHNKPERAFHAQESQLMSGRTDKTPNYDLFRAIQVADSQGVAANGVATIVNAAVVPAGLKGIPIAIEAIDKDCVFTTRIKFDDYLLRQQAHKFHWGDQAETVTQLLDICRAQGLQRLEQELNFWHPRDKQMATWYTHVLHEAKASSGAYIELGWGTGWMSKTLGQTLRTINPRLVPKLIERYNLKRGKGNPDTFPSTRRVATDQNKPISPLGWVRLDWEH